MDLRKTLVAVVACSAVSVAAFAAGGWKLPKAHSEIADNQVESNLAGSPAFVAASFDEVSAATPFADIREENINAESEAADPTAERMVSYAERFLGTRYVLGASGPKAFDCSGFTSYIYKNFGITLNRSSREQYLQGQKVAVNNLRPGDLLFFSSRSAGRGRVGHVAMVVSVDASNGSCTFIHASTKKGVTYQRFPDGGYYSRNFIGARRILGTDLATDLATL